MMLLDSSKPLGLPDGSVRAIIALTFTTCTLYLWSTTGTPDIALVAITTGIVQNYFNNSHSRQVATAAAESEALAKPYVPGDEDAGN